MNLIIMELICNHSSCLKMYIYIYITSSVESIEGRLVLIRVGSSLKGLVDTYSPPTFLFHFSLSFHSVHTACK